MAKIKKTKNLSETITENFWAIWFFVVISLILVFVAKQDALANFVWQKYRSADLALVLIKRDSNLAIQIGNYYFNGTIGRSEYDLDRAEESFKKALEIKKGILWGHYQLARIYFIKGDFGKALEEINEELKFNPGNVRSFYVRGLIFGYRGDLAEAESDFKIFIKWMPLEWAGYNDLAWILSKEGKYKEAETAIYEALKNVLNGNENPWLWNSLGVAQLNLKDYTKAKKSFEKALDLAKKLTENDWRRSYPGNNPLDAKNGLFAFFGAIGENLRRAKAGVDNPR